MEIIKTPSHRPTSLHVAFCIWILSTVCSLQSGTSSLQGMKVLFQGQQCQYWELKQGRMVPPLEQLTVCVDLCRQTNTKKWTAFTYNRVDQPTQNTPELGLAGYEDKLQVWLFGESFNASVELSLWSWNSICFTWSSKTKQLVLYVNGSSVFNTTLTGPRHLAPNGTLTLGAAHEISNGQVHIKTANNFLGELYFFRMWKEERSAHELSEDRCNNGSVIQWHSDNWNTHSCNLEPDTKLQCAPLEDHPTLPRPKDISHYKIEMIIIVITRDTGPLNASLAKTFVKEWLNSTFQPNITVHNVSLSPIPPTLAFWIEGEELEVPSGPAPVLSVGRIPQENSPIRTRFFSIVFINVTWSLDFRDTEKQIIELLSRNYTSENRSMQMYTENVNITLLDKIPVPTPFPVTQVTGVTPVSATTQDATGIATVSVTATPSTTIKTTSPGTNSTPTGSAQQTSTEIWSTPPPPVTDPAQTHVTTPTSPGPTPSIQVSFYRVSLDVNVSGVTEDPVCIIEAWLFNTLPGNMNVFNVDMLITQGSNLLGTNFACREKHNFEKMSRAGQISCPTKFQMMVKSSENNNDTMRQIEQYLQKEYNNNFTAVEAENSSIEIVLINPGNCPKQSQFTPQGSYLWPETEVQNLATQHCEGDAMKNATRNCVVNAKSNQAQWKHPDLLSCPTLLSTIPSLNNITVTANNSQDLAELIKNMTSNQGISSHEDLIIVVFKLLEIVKIGILTPPLGQTIIDIINNILETNIDLQPVTNDILEVTDTLGNKLIFDGMSLNVSSPMLALSILNVDPTDFNGMAFGVSSFSEGINPEIFINQEPFDNMVAFISLPPSLQIHLPVNPETGHSRVQFQFYGKQELFQDPANVNLSTYVVAASVTNATIRNLKDPITVTLRHLKPNIDNHEVECVYWDLGQNGGKGGWSSEGCEKKSTTVNHTTCFCYHLTHFGVLLDPFRTPLDAQDNRILTLITYVGCGLSSVFLGISLLTYTAFEKLRRDYPSKILMNLSAALLGMNMVFLVNSWLASFEIYSLCISVAVFLHYFLLASFTWMGLEAVHMYFALVKVFNVYVPSYILKFCVLGWGVPLVVVGVILAINKDAYGSELFAKSVSPLEESEELFCWVQDGVTFYVSVVAFFLLILLCNVSVFIVVLVQIRNMKAKKPVGSHSGVLYNLRSVASLTFLLGLTWGLAFLAFGPAKLALLYLFSIFNSLQGFFIFLFHCLMKENVRKQWRIHLCCGRFRLNEHSDWSRSGTIGKSRVKQLVHTPSVKSAKSDNSNSTSSTSNESDSGRQLVSSLGLVYKNNLAVPRAHISPSFPSALAAVPRDMEMNYQVSWLPRERSY